MGGKKMNNLQESFEKAINDFYTVDWSETDGSDVREIFETYFDDIPTNRIVILKMIEDSTRISKFQRQLAVKMLEAC